MGSGVPNSWGHNERWTYRAQQYERQWIMASSVNKAIIVGNLGRDPEVRYTSGGQAVANFSVATSEQWADKQSGEKKEKTEWHRIVVWGKVAELCGQYLAKGRKVYIEGRLQSREWTNKEGQKMTSTEIVANQVVFLGGKDGGEGKGGRAATGSGDEFGSPPPGFDEGPSSGGGSGSGNGGGSSGPGNDDIPF
jgi:single-strand DNA-binding protein